MDDALLAEYFPNPSDPRFNEMVEQGGGEDPRGYVQCLGCFRLFVNDPEVMLAEARRHHDAGVPSNIHPIED